MKVNLTKQFEKDFNKIEDKITRSNIFRVIRNIQASKNIRDISKTKPLSGYPGYFRIKRVYKKFGAGKNKKEYI
jgi:mRNA-degrading endonuclease YafQ of YafQ-DinJ toxin-antitoxin module